DWRLRQDPALARSGQPTHPNRREERRRGVHQKVASCLIGGEAHRVDEGSRQSSEEDGGGTDQGVRGEGGRKGRGEQAGRVREATRRAREDDRGREGSA